MVQTPVRRSGAFLPLRVKAVRDIWSGHQLLAHLDKMLVLPPENLLTYLPIPGGIVRYCYDRLAHDVRGAPYGRSESAEIGIIYDRDTRPHGPRGAGSREPLCKHLRQPRAVCMVVQRHDLPRPAGTPHREAGPDRMRKLLIELGGTRTIAERHDAVVPKTCDAVWTVLPLEGMAIHANWSGREIMRRLHGETILRLQPEWPRHVRDILVVGFIYERDSPVRGMPGPLATQHRRQDHRGHRCARPRGSTDAQGGRWEDAHQPGVGCGHR